MNTFIRRLRIVFYTLAALTACAVGAWAYIQFVFLGGGVKTQVQQALSNALKGRAVIGSVRADWKADLVFQDVEFTVPAGKYEARVSVPRTYLSLRYGDLIFRKRPIEQCLRAITFDAPKVVWAPSTAAPTPVVTPAPGGADLSPNLPIPPVDQWLIRSGKLLVVHGQEAPVTSVGSLDLTANRSGEQYAIKMVLLPPGNPRKRETTFKGVLKAEGPTLEGMFRMERWPLETTGALLQNLAGVQPLSGSLSGELPIQWRYGTPLHAEAHVLVQDASLRVGNAEGLVLNGIQADAEVGTEEIRLLKPAAFQTGKTAWVVAGVLPLDGAPVSLTATTTSLDLGSLLSNLRAGSRLEASGVGKAAFDLTGTLKDPQVHVVAEVGATRVGEWNLNALSFEGFYRQGTFKLNRAEGSLYDGELTASGEWTPARGAASPVTLGLKIRHIRTQPLAELLGLKDWDGRTDLTVDVGGTLEKPTLSVRNDLAVERVIQGKTYKYVFKNEVRLSGDRLRVSTRVNNDSRFESEWVEKTDRWEIATLSLKTPASKSSLLTGSGYWPKKNTDPVDIHMTGQRLDVGQTPFLKEHFPGVKGVLSFDAHLQGTRHDPRLTFRADSPALRLGLRQPEAFALSAFWTPQSLRLERLSWGKTLDAKGTVGLQESSPMDVQIEAHALPLAFLTGLFDVESNDKKPLEGTLTGRLRCTGTRGKPLIDGRAAVTGFRFGDWALDTLDAEMSVEGDRVSLKSFTAVQEAGGLLTLKGWLKPGEVSKAQFDLEARRFLIPSGPRLSGKWHASLETPNAWFKETHGHLTGNDLSAEGSDGGRLVLPPLSTEIAWKDRSADFTWTLGTVMRGQARWITGVSPSRFSARLNLLPADLSDHPILSQAFPKDWKVAGPIQGEVTIPEGPIDHPTFEAKLQVGKGRLQGYTFDQIDLAVSGDTKKMSPRLNLTRGTSKYQLSGTLESPDTFFSPRTNIHLEGPFENETFPRLLALLGLDTSGHAVSGHVSVKLVVDGTLAAPRVGLQASGNSLVWDDTLVDKAELHASLSKTGLILDKTSVVLDRGSASLEEASLSPVPGSEGAYAIKVKGSAKDLPLAALKWNGRLVMEGTLRPSPGPGQNMFSGIVSAMDGAGTSASGAYSLRCVYRDRVLSFSPAPGGALVRGDIDFSQKGRMTFRAFHAEVEGGVLDVNGTVDTQGPCDLTSDAKNLRVERVGRWVSKDFPLSGTGNFHLILQGTLEKPLLNASFSFTGGKAYGLAYDLLDGTLVGRDNLLRVGSPETPFTLSRAGVYAFTLHGTMPFALSSQGWKALKNHEMDLTAAMPKGDLGLFLLAGFAKKAEGPLDFNARVTGTLDHPIVTADLDFHGGRIVPKMIATSIDDIQGRVKIRSNAVEIQDLNARIGQGRVFFWTPPADQSKMVLDGFAPKYYDLRVRTPTERGVLLNIPAIMRPGEWGEVRFYGSRPEDPLLIVGPSDEPHVVGTARLETGHYTFPPVVAKDDSGKEITYKELASVYFQLSLVAGSDCWYSNDFSTNYLEMKVNPESIIYIEGKDANKTPNRAGIQSRGSAGSREGWLRYLNREFRIQQAFMHIPKGEMPVLQGRATDRLKDADIVTPAGSQKMDVDLWIDFNGPIGAVDFKLDSNPRFTSGTDDEANQQLLLSYVLFGKDMTGYTREALHQAYEQQVGKEAGQSVLQALDRVAAVELSRKVRRLTRGLGGVEVNLKSGLFQEAGRNPANGTDPNAVDPSGNTLPATGSRSVASLELKKYLDQRFAVVSNFGYLKDNATDRASFQKQVGVDYDVTRDLSLNTRVGQNDEGIAEQKVGFSFRTMLPDVMKGDRKDKTPPKLERFEVYSLGPGTVQVLWTTDKVTKSDLRILNEEGEELRKVVGDRKFAYYHEVVIEKLEPDTEYGVQLSVRDLNGNVTSSTVKTVSTPPS